MVLRSGLVDFLGRVLGRLIVIVRLFECCVYDVMVYEKGRLLMLCIVSSLVRLGIRLW